MRKLEVIIAFVILLLAINVSALYIPDDNQASFGHVITIKEIKYSPLSPGENGFLNITLKNNGKSEVSDIEIELALPNEFQFYKDSSKIKMSQMMSGQEKEISYNIIPTPSSKEGIYKANMTIDYISHFGANDINVGQNQQDKFSLGLIIQSYPSLFAILESSEIYNGNGAGSVSIKFVNNGTSDIKFLTVNLKESLDYEIMAEPIYYVGDLDSDDFQTVSYNIKLNGEKSELILPVSVNYKDSLNQDYSNEFYIKLKIRSASDSGKTNNNYFYYIIAGIVVLIIVVIYFYVKSTRRKKG